jgi:hypothetical protein
MCREGHGAQRKRHGQASGRKGLSGWRARALPFDAAVQPDGSQAAGLGGDFAWPPGQRRDKRSQLHAPAPRRDPRCRVAGRSDGRPGRYLDRRLAADRMLDPARGSFQHTPLPTRDASGQAPGRRRSSSSNDDPVDARPAGPPNVPRRSRARDGSVMGQAAGGNGRGRSAKCTTPPVNRSRRSPLQCWAAWAGVSAPGCTRQRRLPPRSYPDGSRLPAASDTVIPRHLQHETPPEAAAELEARGRGSAP